ncbi:hypothetical protein [Rhizobium sp. C4]|uniref:hypothetical protein n=1 Tax=Rhizobium sp. C4 TaxID=1349800 RepID=UPI001E582A9B|nr:hypothetical protein [Rhizobium sp. C4]MCD2173563.1 hypothetical protein [Rhizobium sp. C4]
MTPKIATSRLADPGDNWHGPVVEFTTDDHMTLIVNMPLSASEAEVDPINRALSALTALSGSAEAERASRGLDGGASSARTAQNLAELEDQLNQGLEDSFPASDPVATIVTSTLPKRGTETG